MAHGTPHPASIDPFSRSIAAILDRPWLAATLLGAVTLLVFLPAVACDFVNWDDTAYVSQNRLVLEGLTLRGVEAAFAAPVFHNWAPLTTISYQLDATLFGGRPAGFHLTNVILHAASVALLFLALERMTGAAGRSAAAAMLFGLHPMRVESVAWIAERKDVLSVLFLTVALVAYERACRRPGIAGSIAVWAAMLLSLLSKATLVTLPVLLLLLDVWPLGRLGLPWSAGPAQGERRPSPYPAVSWRRAIVEKLPMFALSLLFVVITLRTQARAMVSEATMPLVGVRIPNAICAMGWYLWKTVWPTGLHPAHEHSGEAGPLWLVLTAAAAIVALLLVAWRLRRACPAIGFGVCWFVAALAPVIGIVQVGFQAYAERFTYVPHVGLMVAVVWSCARAAARFRLPARVLSVALAAVAAAFASLDRLQIETWKNSEVLWRHVLSLVPDSVVGHCNLGAAFYDQGRLQDAIAEFRMSLAIRDTERARTWLGLALADSGRPEEALAEYGAALALNPDSAEAHNNVGIVLARMGRLSEAVVYFERACDLSPGDRDSLANLRRARVELKASEPGR